LKSCETCHEADAKASPTARFDERAAERTALKKKHRRSKGDGGPIRRFHLPEQRDISSTRMRAPGRIRIGNLVRVGQTVSGPCILCAATT
jgi:hypothetical protein